MKKITRTLSVLLVLLLTNRSQAQLSGTYSIPGSYASIAAAINDLNTNGVSGAVTINIAAGFTETAVSGGYTLNAIVGASSSNQITFQKSGSGANPIVYAYTGGVGTPSNAVQDGIWRFSGTDWVTINGIDLNDPNTSNPATMEFGYGFFKASATDGCQNNTIRNCVITLNRINNIGGSAPAIDGSRGIEFSSAAISNHTTVLTVTAASGANSNNKVYSNTIQNCNYGVSLIGFADSSPFSLADANNDIGGSSSVTGNTIINFGGGTTSPAAGIRTLAQYNVNVSYNTINSNNGSGVGHGQALRGIFLNTATSANATANNNTITLVAAGTTQQVTGIDNAAGSTAATNTININNNLITNCTYSSATSGNFYGITSSSSPDVLNINNNLVTNNGYNGTSGSIYSIYNSGTVARLISINSNNINGMNFTGTSTSLTYRSIYNTSAGSSATMNINANNIQAVVFTNTSSATVDFLYNSGTALVQNIQNNTLTNLSINTTGSMYLINCNNTMPANGSRTISGNSIVTGFSKLLAGGTVYGYYSFSTSPVTCSEVNANNNFSNITLTGATALNLWLTADGPGSSPFGPAKIVTGNTFTNVTGGTSGVLGIYAGYSNVNAPGTVSNNLVSNFNCGGAVAGFSLNNGSFNTYSNTIRSFTSSGASSVFGIHVPAGTVNNIYGNRIFDLQTSNAGGSVIGINIASGTTNSIYNNLVGDLKAPVAVGNNPLIGISLTGGTTDNVYFNTVYLNATSSGSLFGSSAISMNTSPTTITLRNNIFVNTSVATGTGVTVASRRSSTATTNYGTTSNNNLFYAGTPGSANLIFTDGTNLVQTLSAYKTLMPSWDAVSVTESPSFVSIAGSNANFLNINTVTPTQIESGASAIAGVTTDYAGTSRSSTSPDIGAWEGTYVLNDITPPAMTGSGFTTPICGLSGRTFTASFSDASGLASGLLSPRIYYKVNAGSYTSVSGTLTSGTVNNGVWTFNMVYSASISDVISYYVVAQDAFATSNIAAFPSAGFSGTDVNTIVSAPTTPNTYGVNTLNGVYTVGASGTFTSLTSAANAYNTFCITGPVTFSLTDALYSTAEVFPITFKNTSYANATNSLLIVPAAGVNVVVTPTVASLSSIIKFQDAHYITIDGINAGGALNINNSTASAAVANIWLASTNAVGAGNSFITIRRTALNGASNASSNGVVSSIDGAAPSTTGGNDNDNITISNNTMQVVYNGVLAAGGATVSAGGSDNWTISGNAIGSSVVSSTNTIGQVGIYMNNSLGAAISSNTILNASSGSSGCVSMLNSSGFVVTANTIQNFTTSATSGGVYVSAGTNFSITGNTIQNFRSTSSGGVIYVTTGTNFVVSANAISSMSTSSSNYHGININSTCSAFSVSQNTLNNFVSGSTTTGNTSAIAAIYLGSSVVSGTVNYNMISAISNTATGGYGARGMMLNTTGTSSLVIHNNFISDIFSYSDAGGAYWPIGIGFEGSTGGVSLYNNSVNLFGTHAGLTGATGSAAMYLNGGANNALVNNIFANTYDNSSSTSEISYGIYSAVGAANTPTMDYNNYYVGGAAASQVLGYVGSARTTLYALQSAFAFGQNLHSLNFQPQFTSNTDLHLQAASVSNAGLNNAAVPLASVLIDIDGQARSSTTPDIGADEFTATGTCTSAAGGTLPVTSATACTTGSILATPSNVSSGLGTTYQWKVGVTPGGPYSNITTGTGTSSPTYFSGLSSFAPGVYYVVLQANCASPTLSNTSNEATVTIIAGPSVSITTTNTLVCQGKSATLTAAGTATSYAWSTSATTSTISITPSANTVYTLTGTSGICSAVSTINIVYSAAPTVTVTSTPTVCSNVAATLTAAGATTYSWNTGATTAVINPTQSATTGYTVTGYNVDGCASASVPATITVNQAPVLNITGSSGLCTGQTASLTVSGASSYTWSTGSNATTITDAPTTNTVYTVSGTSTAGCISTTNQSVSVAASLLISISGPTAICIGQPANLSANGGVTYLWDDGSTTSTIAPSPTTNKTYSVIGSSGTCSNSAVFSLTVNPLPTLGVSGTTITCAGVATTFTANGASTYSWNTGATTASLSVAPTTNTTYVVTGTSTLGCKNNFTVSVNTNSLPVITIAPSSTGVCVNSSATLTASGANSYTWNLSGNPTTTAVTVSPLSTTVYTVNGKNAANCVSSKTISITSYALPILTITPVTATVCALAPANFAASGATNYTWSASGGTNASVTYTPGANATYTVTGSDANGCVNTNTAAVTTNSLPVISITPASPTVCSMAPTTFTASGGASYVWNGSTPGATYTGVSAANTTFTVSGFSSAGCGMTQTVGLTTLPLPSVVVTPSYITVCALSTGIYTVSGANSYTWANNSTATTVAITPSATTLYSVVGMDANGCIGVGSAIVLTYSLPVISVAPASATVCPNSSTTFTASGAQSYSWSNGPATATSTVTPASSTVYTVTGTDQNQCSSSKTVAVTTRTVPLITVSPSSFSACLSSLGGFTASGATSYSWSDNSTNDNIIISPSVTTVYTVTGKSNAGCTSVGTATAFIWQPPVINITVNSMTVCAKEVVSFTAAGASSYTWYPFNATGATFTNVAASTLQYMVTGIDVNGCSSSNSITVNVDKCDGIAENALNSIMQVYPNPSTGMITADFGFEGHKTLVVMNSAGAVVAELSTESLREQIDLSQKAKGLYFIHVRAKGATANYRIIIQ